jgi:UDP-N-acetylglucosamine transferase subunit ALG13
MIFVTVGTDHHPFDRLVKAVDILRDKGAIEEDVFVQKGSSGHPLKACHGEDFISFDEMMDMIQKARIVISHGGPGSIIPVLRLGKIPVVVPREKRYGEVVDDHQISFAEHLQKQDRIILIRDTQDLEDIVQDFEKLIQDMKTSFDERESPEKRLQSFVQRLDQECQDLLKK